MGPPDLDEINRLSREALTWSKDVLVKLRKPNSPSLDHVTKADLNKLLQPDLALVCFKAVHFVGALLDDVETLKNYSSSLQNKVIESQKDVICIQAELSDCKTEQLEML